MSQLTRRALLQLAASGVLAAGCRAERGAHPGVYLNLRGPDGYNPFAATTNPAEYYDRFELVATDLATFETHTHPVHFPAHSIAVSRRHPNLAVLVEKWGPHVATFDWTTGDLIARLDFNDHREAIGHATFSSDGESLFVSEGRFDPTEINTVRHGEGIIAVRDPRTLALRNEFPSHGHNPHELHLLSDGRTLVVCNQGRNQAPETASTIACIDTVSGTLLESIAVPDEAHLVAHLQVTRDDTLLVVTKARRPEHRDNRVYIRVPGGPLEPLPVPDPYAGRLAVELLSIAIDERRRRVACTCPAGDLALIWDYADRRLLRVLQMNEPLGVSLTADGASYIVADMAAGTVVLDAESLEVRAAGVPEDFARTRFTAAHSTIALT